MSLDKTPAKVHDSRRMLDRVRNWWDSRRGASALDNVYEVAVLATLGLGTYLRAVGWLVQKTSFWLDEALWASRLLHQPLMSLGIRPVGFMGITRFFVQLFGAREVWFRLLPALGGIGALLLMPYVASRLIANRWLRVALLLLFAIHPALVDYCNEFKPYSWEVLVHLVPVALYLRYRETQHRAWFFALLAYLPVGFLLAYNLALAFPGLLLLCLWIAWRSPQRKQWVLATLVSGALCAGAGATVFAISLHKVTKEERTESYWGKKYDVFYEKTEPQSRVDWTVQKLNDQASFVNLSRNYWHGMSDRQVAELSSVDRLFWMSLTYVGLFVLWRKRRDLLVVLLVPLGVMVLGNLAGKWPLGAFRTNLFVLAYAFPLPFIAMDFLATTRQRAAVLATLMASLTFIPDFRFGVDWHGHKRAFTRDFYEREVLAELYQQRKAQLDKDPELPRARLYVELHSLYPLQFYLHDHPDYREKYEKFFEANFIVDRTGTGSQKKLLLQRVRQESARQGFWIVNSSRRESENLEGAAARSPNKTTVKDIRDEHLVIYVAPREE